MENKNKQTVLEEAKRDFQAIIDYAKENVSAELQEKIEDKIAKLINEDSFNESVTVSAGGKTITIDDDGEVDVQDDSSEDSILTGEEGEPEVDETESDLENVDDFFEISDEMEEYEIEEETNLYNEEMPQPQEQPQQEMPIEDQPQGVEQEPMPAPAPAPEAEPAGEDLNSKTPEELLVYAIEQIAKESGSEAADPSGEEAVEIIDDEVPETSDPVTEPAPAPAPQEQPVAEEIDIDSLLEDEESIIEIADDVNDEMGEVSEDDIIEIEGDSEEGSEDTVDEMKAMGVSHSVQRGTGKSAGPSKSVETRSRQADMNENKKPTQYDALNAGVKKDNTRLVNENAKLKKEVKKLRTSLPALRKQINEMKEFNAKVGFMFKLFEHGDFTREQKVQITEKFGQVDGYDDSKTLFKEIMNENNINTKSIPESIKPANTGSNIERPAAKKETLFESSDARRMRELVSH